MRCKSGIRDRARRKRTHSPMTNGYVLAKEEDGGDGDEDGGELRNDLVEEQRQGLHARRVGEQQNDEEEMATLEEREDACCVLALRGRAT